jgi:histidinol-phosphate aminotransferase
MNIAKIVRPNLSIIKDYVPGKPIEEVQREYGITDVIKLASNENPLGASPKAVAAMLEEVSSRSHLYPDGSSYDLIHKLAKKYQITPEQIFVESGLDGVITKLGMAFMNPGDEIIISQYSFPAYETITHKMAAVPVLIPQTADYRIHIDGIIAAITPKTKMICLCNPNNPTGTIYTTSEFEKLLAAVPTDVLIVSDEAYYEFVDDPTYPQTLSYLDKTPNLLVMRTFSKVYGLASVRIGYAIGAEELIKPLLKVREPFAVNRIAQAGALAAMDDDAFMQATISANRQAREKYYQAFERLGIKYYPSHTNFILFKVNRPAADIYETMLKEGVIIRPLAVQGLPYHLRISIGTESENQRAIAALEKALTSLD